MAATQIDLWAEEGHIVVEASGAAQEVCVALGMFFRMENPCPSKIPNLPALMLSRIPPWMVPTAVANETSAAAVGVAVAARQMLFASGRAKGKGSKGGAG